MAFNKTGKILLGREEGVFTAGFCIFESTFSELLENVSLLHPEERAYFDTLKYKRRKASYLLGRMAAKNAVAELTETTDLTDIWIDTGVFRFPVVKLKGKPNIQTSISHCNTVGLALAFPEAHPLGIDLEYIDKKRLKVLESQVTETEKEILSQLNLPQTISFTLLWTVKEGVSKALRTGLTMDFKILTVKAMKRRGKEIESAYYTSNQYKAFSSYFGNYAISVVTPRKTQVNLGVFWDACEQALA